MKKILLLTLFVLSVFAANAQNPLVGKPSLKLVFDAAQTKKWEWIVDTNNGLTINGTGGTPSITYSGYTGTGTSLAALNASGVFTRINNGSNGQFLTLTAGVPTWVASPATSPGGSTTQLQYNNGGAFGGISGATSDGTSVTLTSPTISGGTIDGTVIGATTPSTGAFTTLGVGIASPSRQATIFGTDPYLQFANVTTGSAIADGLQIQLNTSDGYLYNYENGFLAFGTNDQVRMTINANGSITAGSNSFTAGAISGTTGDFSGNVNLSAGALQFGGTTAISSTRAATLSAVRSTDLAGTGSDIVYADTDGDLVRSTVEISSVVAATEGTYVPSIRWFGGSAGITYSTQTGYYVKNGKSVTFSATIVVTDKGSDTGGLYMTIPVAARASSPAFQYVMFYGTEMASVFDRDYLAGQIDAGASELTVVTATNNTTPAGIDAASFDGLPFTVRVSGTYIVD